MSTDTNKAPYDTPFALRAHRTRSTGLGLLLLTGLSWIYVAVLLFTPYSAGDYSNHCDPQALSDREHVYEECEAKRDWPKLMGFLTVAFPLGIVGVGLYVSGSTRLQLREYVVETPERAEQPSE